jgi:hypothetical protein
MSTFNDILNRPLPSRSTYNRSGKNELDFLFESEDEGDVQSGFETDDNANEDTSLDETIEGCCSGKCEDSDDDSDGLGDPNDDFDVLGDDSDDDDLDDDDSDGLGDPNDDLDDDDSDGLGDPNDDLEDPTENDDAEIAGYINDIVDSDPDFDVLGDDSDDDDLDDADLDDDSSDEDPRELSPEDDAKANDLMAVAATPLIIKDELDAEESVGFYESADAEIAVNEGLILESDLDDLYQEGVFASPNQKFKMTKKARYNQLFELSVQIEGRMHNDPMYVKLQKAYKIERICKKNLRKKYYSQAKRRAIIYLKRLTSSKSGVLSKIGQKLGVKKK